MRKVPSGWSAWSVAAACVLAGGVPAGSAWGGSRNPGRSEASSEASSEAASEAASESASAAAGTLTSRWTVLHLAAQSRGAVGPLPEDGRLRERTDLEFTGPEPGHPFVLGQFAVDGRFALQDGVIELAEGHNAALHLGRGENFQLEGQMEMTGYGGFFFLIGWDQGRGYSISNVTMRESGSPWFITEYRGHKAIEGAHEQITKFEWRRVQPFRLTVRNQAATLEVGRVTVFEDQPLANYSAGDILLGVYDTRYGPRPVRIGSLRIRAVN